MMKEAQTMIEGGDANLRLYSKKGLPSMGGYLLIDFMFRISLFHKNISRSRYSAKTLRAYSLV